MPGTSSHNCGAPGLAASRALTTAGKGSMSSATASAASLALRDGFRDHAGDRIADETHFVGGQRRARRVFDRRAVAALERQIAFQPAIGGKIGAGQNRQHARHGLGGVGIDAADDPVRLARAHHHRIGLVRQVDIVGVAAFAAHQSRVFFARDRLSDAEFGLRKGGFGGSVIHFGGFTAVV